MKGKIPATIDEYIESFQPSTKKILEAVRTVVQQAAPDAQEAIKYGMPTYVLGGNLVHFAAFTNHIGFYPTPDGTEQFRKELAKFKSGKGSVQFPIDEPMPLALITKMVKYRVASSVAKAKLKK